MTNYDWVRIRSWHAVKSYASALSAGYTTTLCGRKTESTVVATMQSGKSCEICLRAVAKSVDG